MIWSSDERDGFQASSPRMRDVSARRSGASGSDGLVCGELGFGVGVARVRRAALADRLFGRSAVDDGGRGVDERYWSASRGERCQEVLGADDVDGLIALGHFEALADPGERGKV